MTESGFETFGTEPNEVRMRRVNGGAWTLAIGGAEVLLSARDSREMAAAINKHSRGARVARTPTPGFKHGSQR